MSQFEVSTLGPIDFNVLRARLEGDVPRPGIVLITAATTTDGSDVAARSLALSLSAIDYQALLVDGSLGLPSLRKVAYGTKSTKLEEATRSLDRLSKPGTYAEIGLDEFAQQTTSRAALSGTLNALRTKFDYLIIHADYTLSTSFTTLAIDLADAIFVAVRAARRETKSDRQLASALNRAASRFSGVLSMPPALLKEGLIVPTLPSVKGDAYVSPAEQPIRARG
jgi:hypothetical protein